MKVGIGDDLICPTYAQCRKQIVDAGKGEPPPPSSSTLSATEAGRSSSSFIGRATLGESDLGFPETGPPCKVLELPLELPTASTAARGGVRRRHAHAQGGPHRPAIVLFIERPPRVFLETPPPPPPPSQETPSTPISTSVLSTSTAAIHDGATAAAAAALSPNDGSATRDRAAAASPSDGSGGEGHTAHQKQTMSEISREDVVVVDDESRLSPNDGSGDESHTVHHKTISNTNREAVVVVVDDESGKAPPPRPPPPASAPAPPLASPSSSRLASGKMQLKVLEAWGLAVGAKYLDVVVAVRACGRDVGTTLVSAVGGTTSPEWIDQQ